MFRKINKFFLTLILKTIRLYQHTLSPDQGWFRVYYPHGFCRFYPHCSEYGHRAFKKYGIFGGGYKTLWRLVRCHPLSKGGHDPV